MALSGANLNHKKLSDKKKVAILGGILAGGATLVYLLQAGVAAAKTVKLPSVQVQLDSNPIPTILLVDGKEIATPAKLLLAEGVHTFAAVPKSPADVWVTYGFDKWTQNGQVMSLNRVARFYVKPPSIITAQYMLVDVGLNAPCRPDSLPNPTGPMTPNLVFPNTNLVIET